MEQFKAASTRATDQASDPNQLNLLRMIESRIVEIVQIESDIKKKNPKLFQQRLPRYMRRRAASHNPNRVPKRLRMTKMRSKDRRKLFLYRQRMRYRKHKRVLKRHSLHKYKEPNKTILHKWFAKRFKMEKQTRDGMQFVPLHSNTKNFRNLYRQTRYGCAYISMAHLVAYRVISPYDTQTIDQLNRLTTCVSGFTFAARSLENGRYETVIHLYKKQADGPPTKTLFEGRTERALTYLCPAIVSNHKTHWTLWVPRIHSSEVEALLESTTKLSYCRVIPREAMRVRLVGPQARAEAMKLAQDLKKHQAACEDVDLRLMASHRLGATIGRFLEEKHALFTYYQTSPPSVDVVFRNKRDGRMLWHKLVKNKAHLVGGKRDVEQLLEKQFNQHFLLKPDS